MQNDVSCIFLKSSQNRPWNLVYPECNLFATAEVQSELDKRGFIKYRIICTLSATMCRLVFQLINRLQSKKVDVSLGMKVVTKEPK